MNFRKSAQAVFYFSNIMNDLLTNDHKNCKFEALKQCFNKDSRNLNIPEFTRFVSDFGNNRHINNGKMWYDKQFEHIHNLVTNEVICDYFIDLYKQIYFGH